MVNNGITGNYVIGTVDDEGTIHYEVVGESTTFDYLDSLVKGDSSVKVKGDVVIDQKILDAISSQSATIRILMKI